MLNKSYNVSSLKKPLDFPAKVLPHNSVPLQIQNSLTPPSRSFQKYTTTPPPSWKEEGACDVSYVFSIHICKDDYNFISLIKLYFFNYLKQMKPVRA